MKTLFVVRDEFRRLVPADPLSLQLLEGLKFDRDYKIEIKEDRSRGDLKLYWAGIGLLVKNYTGPESAMVFINDTPVDPGFLWPSSRLFHEMLMRAMGKVTRKYFIDHDAPEGIGWSEEVDSIALDNMDDEEFTAYWELAQALTEEIFGWNPWEEWKAIHPRPNQPDRVPPEEWERNFRPGIDDRGGPRET